MIDEKCMMLSVASNDTFLRIKKQAPVENTSACRKKLNKI
jgi:hypothetical protein